MMKKGFLLLGALMFLLVPAVALADSISPTSFSGSGPTGASYTVNKTVTIDEGPGVTKGDIFFLADTTGSMGGAIAAVKAAAAALLTSTSAFGDIAWGVGEYKDIFDGFRYRLNQDITTTQASVTAGIDMWGASGGGDEPEAQLPALKDVADGASWRAGSERIVVWFGDAPGHNPRDGVTEAQATAALVAKGIQVEAISVGANRLDLTGQATRIAAATGGHFYSGINQAAIVAAIDAALGVAFSTYSIVSLDVSEAAPNVGVVVSPVSYVGAFDRSVTRTFDFEVTFTDLVPGDHSFNIYATVDGGRVATESDRIVSTTGVPEPGVMILLGTGLVALAGLRRKIKK